MVATVTLTSGTQIEFEIPGLTDQEPEEVARSYRQTLNESKGFLSIGNTVFHPGAVSAIQIREVRDLPGNCDI